MLSLLIMEAPSVDVACHLRGIFSGVGSGSLRRIATPRHGVRLPEKAYSDTGRARAGDHVRATITPVWSDAEYQMADDITGLLAQWQQGDAAALERLWPVIGRELRALARRHLSHERRDLTMLSSSLVNEALMRLLPRTQLTFQDRAHFFALASHIMRHVLVDYARRRRRAKRGSAVVHVPMDAAVALAPEQIEQIVFLDLALERLAKVDERKCKVVEMRLFGGLSVEEAAAALGVAPHTVIRDWNFAHAWLNRELAGEAGSANGQAGTG